MWVLVENEYSKKYGIGCATFFRDKQLKTAMVMYKYNGRSVMFCYSEYDNKILSDGDKNEIEMTIKKKLNFWERGNGKIKKFQSCGIWSRRSGRLCL